MGLVGVPVRINTRPHLWLRKETRIVTEGSGQDTTTSIFPRRFAWTSRNSLSLTPTT